MAAKGLDLGKAFFQGVIAKITDPEAKAAAEKLLGNELVLTEIGSGVAGQSEIDRQLQAAQTRQEELDALNARLDEREAGLTQWHGRLDTWYTTNKDAIERGKAGGDGNGGPKPKKVEPPVGMITEEQLNERLVAERAAFLGYDRDRGQILASHFEKFKEVLNLEPLLKHPKVGDIGLLGVYDLVHKERLEQHAAAEAKKAEDAIRLDERQKTQAQMATMPYPSVTGSGSGSPLDALAVGKPDALTDQAAAHYNRLQAERGAPA
jgi:hypothetical protein